MPKKIIYNSEEEVEAYDAERFFASLRRYGEVEEDKVNELLTEFEAYEPLHVSCLVEVGVKALSEEAAKRYYEDHTDCFEETPDFERLRRITGYLVGTLDRWNDAKRAEEKARVKHAVNGQYTQDEKAEIEAAKLENSVAAQL